MEAIPSTIAVVHTRSVRYSLAKTLLLTTVAVHAFAQSSLERIERLRSEKRYEEAVRELAIRVERSPNDTDSLRALAETLSWMKRFDESISRYRELVARTDLPSDELALARVLMWRGDYGEARWILDPLRTVGIPDAEELLARTDYWSGDLRSAENRYELLESERRLSDEGRNDLAQIRDAMRPTAKVDVSAFRDDQPLDAVASRARYTWYTDPLTSITAGAGQRWTSSSRAPAFPFAEAGARLSLPRARLTLHGNARAARTSDDSVKLFPSFAAVLRTGDGEVSLRAERRQLLETLSALTTNAGSTDFRLEYRRAGEAGRIAAAGYEVRKFFDENRASGADFFFIEPLVTAARWSLLGGIAGSWRDTRESRFRIRTAVASPDGGAFRIRYTGEFAPYPTPHDALEGRLIAAITYGTGDRLRARLQSSGGWGRDRAVGFGPELDDSPSPATYAFFYRRRYNPWDASLTLQWKLSDAFQVEAALSHFSTAFYDSNQLAATLARRF
jgi:tetratricopeptide (TPR) repeat protein